MPDNPLEVLAFYANPDNWRSRSAGFALQYDPEPSPVAADAGRRARDAVAEHTSSRAIFKFLDGTQELRSDVEPGTFKVCERELPYSPPDEMPRWSVGRRRVFELQGQELRNGLSFRLFVEKPSSSVTS